MGDETKARDEICEVGLSLFSRGLTFGSTGNISVRLSDGGWLMTPTNASLGKLDPANLSKFDSEGRLVSGGKPTKEAFLHFCMYKERADARAVVHLHSTHSVAVSLLADVDPRDALPPLTAYFVMRVGPVAACALLSARRRKSGQSGRCLGRRAPCGAARQSWACRRRNISRKRPICD